MRGILNINGIEYEVDYSYEDKLLETLRRLGLKSVRKGCETLSCSVCTVLVDKKPINSCSMFVSRVIGCEITTVEGVPAEAEKISRLMSSEGVDQCGYCAPGFVMTLIGLKYQVKDPTDEKILDYFRGNLCRCSGYERQLKAIKNYLEVK
ncbi:MAG: 2Fe-2S iron-sulfur cluster-binding protein [Clostridium sp.]